MACTDCSEFRLVDRDLATRRFYREHSLYRLCPGGAAGGNVAHRIADRRSHRADRSPALQFPPGTPPFPLPTTGPGATRSRPLSSLTVECRGGWHGRWPEAIPGRAWKWNWRRLAIIPLVCAALIAAAFLVQIEPRHKPLPLPTAKPPALAQVEEWLNKLAQSPAIDPASLEQPRQEAEQLAKQQAQDWYSHAGLEAADHLKTQVEAGMRTMEKNASKIDGALGVAMRAELSDSEANALGTELAGALSALEGNVPSLDRSMASKLGQIDPSKLRSLTRDQIKELQKRLRESKGVCKECLGEGDSESDEESSSGTSDDGNAGVTRGPGAAPMNFNLSGVGSGLEENRIRGE